MKVFPSSQSRREYVETQIARSEAKFRFCKVSAHDAAQYRAIVMRDQGRRREPLGPGPILCLGTRNGREVDLFRVQFFGPRLLRLASRLCERKTDSFRSVFPPVESLGRSDVDRLTPRSAVGVEINPRAARRDVWVGSFDEMPAGWERTFGVLFSNSFDQSQDPHRTAKEWWRVAPPGAYLIFCFPRSAEPTATDPVGDLRLEDVLDLFAGELLYFRDRGSRKGYSEVIVRLDEAGARRGARERLVGR